MAENKMEKKCMTMRLELIDNGSSDTNEDNMVKNGGDSAHQ